MNSKQKFWIRVIVIVLVALMVVSLAFYSIWMIVHNLAEKKKAREANENTNAPTADTAEETGEHDHDHGEEDEGEERTEIYY